jgi:hypothetical protein
LITASFPLIVSGVAWLIAESPVSERAIGQQPQINLNNYVKPLSKNLFGSPLPLFSSGKLPQLLTPLSFSSLLMNCTLSQSFWDECA